jgi:hypothetical protein
MLQSILILICLPIFLGIVVILFLEDNNNKSTVSLQLYHLMVIYTLNSGKFQIIIKVLIVVIAFIWCSDPIQLDVDSDSGEALTSPTENVNTSNQDERQSSPENISGNNEEKDNSEKSQLYQGVPKNELTYRELVRRNFLENDLQQYQSQADHDHSVIDKEAKRIKDEGNTEESINEPLYRDILPYSRQHDGKKMLDLAQELEEIRLKESPTDIGEMSKKRKAE